MKTISAVAFALCMLTSASSASAQISAHAMTVPAATVPVAEPVPAYLQPGRGAGCIDSYSNLQNEVFLGLSSRSNEMMLMSQTCKTQRKTLQLLSQYPRDQRDEVLARLFDAAAANK